MGTKIIKLLLYTINIPIYWLSMLVPKDKSLWIFGAWFGEKYCDNSKYLFEYVNNHHREIRAVWLTKNGATLDLLRSKNFEAYRTYSLKGYFLSMKAGVYILTTGITDVNMFVNRKKAVVQLWHGTPLKKILFDDAITFRRSTFFDALMCHVFPFLKEPGANCLFISTSDKVREIMASAFKAPASNIMITGYPRTDVFFADRQEKVSINDVITQIRGRGGRIGIYLPTHRRAGETDIFTLLLKEIESLESFLSQNNIFLLVKLHFYHLKEPRPSHVPYERIIFIAGDEDINQDIYTVLNLTDFLITDYSSVYFDYLLLDRPIIFAPFDMDEYLIKDREFYFEYDKVTPGPIAGTWEEVCFYVKEALLDPGLYSKERNNIRRLFHTYADGKSSERVFEEVVKRIA